MTEFTVESLRAMRDSIARDYGRGPARHGYQYERRMMQDGNELKTRAADNGAPLIYGYSIVFDSKSVPMGWFGEFEETVARDVEIEYADGDVFSLNNHNWGDVLGRLSAKSLTLKRDDKGLYSETTLIDDPVSHVLAKKIDRGDIRGQSFGMTIVAEEWDESGDIPQAKLTKIRLYEVTVTPIPAYPATDIEVAAARDRFITYDNERQQRREQEQGLLRLDWARRRTAFMGGRGERGND